MKKTVAALRRIRSPQEAVRRWVEGFTLQTVEALTEGAAGID